MRDHEHKKKEPQKAPQPVAEKKKSNKDLILILAALAGVAYMIYTYGGFSG